jgi:phospholipase C
VRKHNPAVIYDAISQDPGRAARIRTFNDFANDVVNGTLPQWVFVTPNMVRPHRPFIPFIIPSPTFDL